MRTLTLALALLIASFTITTLPGAAAQEVPTLPTVPGGVSAPVVGEVDSDLNDGFVHCKRVVGLNACVAVLIPDCTLWLSAGFGGCIVR